MKTSSLSTFRVNAEIKQAELAEKIGLGPDHGYVISNWELRKKPMTNEEIELVAKALNLDESQKAILAKEATGTKRSLAYKKKNGKTEKPARKKAKKAARKAKEAPAEPLRIEKKKPRRPSKEKPDFNGLVVTTETLQKISQNFAKIEKIVKDAGGSIPLNVYNSLLENL